MQYYQQLQQAELQSLWAWFNTVDRDRSGTITAAELTVMNFGGKSLEPRTAQKLIRIFDRDRSNSIGKHLHFSILFSLLPSLPLSLTVLTTHPSLIVSQTSTNTHRFINSSALFRQLSRQEMW
jgi:hypothetical protein